MSYKAKNNFSKATVDTDSAHEYVQEGAVVGLVNFDLFNKGENFVAVPSRGNTARTTETVGKEKTFLGSTVWDKKIYSFYARTGGISIIEEYDTITDTMVDVLTDSANSVEFPEYDFSDLDIFVLSADIVDGVYLHWTWGVRGLDGELSGFGEPKRIHIEDAKANPSGYSNISGNYDRPEKLLVTSDYSVAITNNQLKFGSYIFYKRCITKYDERSILSFPSDCLDVSEGFGETPLHNFIQIGGFTVDDDVDTVEILMSNDSSGTFKIVKSVDTSVSKTVANTTITLDNEYPILDGMASDIINNNFPYTATEQELVSNRIVYGDVEIERSFVDSNGDLIDKNTKFQYTATGIAGDEGNVFPSASDTAGSLTIAYAFQLNSTYRFTITGWKYNTYTLNYEPHVYQFDWNYSGGSSTTDTGLAYKFANANPLFLISPAAVSNFTVTGLNLGQASLNGLTSIKIDGIASGDSKGLNTDFRYSGGIVWMDSKGRNNGVTNITDVFYEGDEWTFDVKPNLSASGITAPVWATKYMFVRDKVTTSLQYGKVFGGVASVAKSGYNVHKIENGLYTNYLSDERGSVITQYSKKLQGDVETQVLTLQDRADESITAEGHEYVYIKDTITVSGLLLYKPVKDVDARTEVFYETSDIFTVSGGVFSGDTVDRLKWYDTKVGEYDGSPMVIMKTDKVSLSDINHLGRGAYTFSNRTDVSGNATIISSQEYTPESNYNGLSDVSIAYGDLKDLDRRYGSVEKLFFDDTNLLVGQRNKWTKVLINKDVLSTATGSAAVTKSSSFFNQAVPYAGDFGITDKRSFSSYGFRRYFVDQDAGIVGRLSVDGISPINRKREEEIVDLLRDHDYGDPIIGGFDISKMEYVCAFHGSNKILRFSEKSGEWVGDYSLTTMPYQFMNAGVRKFSSPQTSSDVLWEENIGLGGGSFYGNLEQKVLSFVVNMEPLVVKDYISTSINGNIPLEVTSGSIAMAMEIETAKNKTSLDLSDFINREGVLYADYMKDENTDGGMVFGVGTVDSIASTTTIELKSPPNSINVGSDVYADTNLIGTVKSFTGTTVVFDANMIYTPSADEFIHTVRESKIEGKSIKGETAKVTITIDDDYNRFFDDDIKIAFVTTNLNISSHTD